MMMEIVYIVMIKDRIMLPSVFNDLFEEGEGGKLLSTTFSFEFLSLLDFYKWILQSVGFIFSII